MRTMISHGGLHNSNDVPDCSYYFTKEHTADAFRAMNNMRLSGDMCDVRLIVGDKCVSAHKIVLAATSPYFHAMFTSKYVQNWQRL